MLEVAGRLVAVLGELVDDDDGLAGIVVGLPSHLDGRPHEHAVRVRAIAEALEQRTGLPVTLQDERLTSVEAEQRLALRERDWRKRKARLDAAAAAIILQDYLDEHSQQAAGRRSLRASPDPPEFADESPTANESERGRTTSGRWNRKGGPGSRRCLGEGG